MLDTACLELLLLVSMSSSLCHVYLVLQDFDGRMRKDVTEPKRRRDKSGLRNLLALKASVYLG